jgi:hypothetical protein
MQDDCAAFPSLVTERGIVGHFFGRRVYDPSIQRIFDRSMSLHVGEWLCTFAGASRSATIIRLMESLDYSIPLRVGRGDFLCLTAVPCIESCEVTRVELYLAPGADSSRF